MKWSQHNARNFCLVAKNGRRILDNNSSLIFLLLTLNFYSQRNGRIFLMVAKIWSQRNFSSHWLGRKHFLVAQKWSHATIFWVCDQKKNLWRKAPSLRLDGWIGYQKCPSMFSTLCTYIGDVYMYLIGFFLVANPKNGRMRPFLCDEKLLATKAMRRKVFLRPNLCDHQKKCDHFYAGKK